MQPLTHKSTQEANSLCPILEKGCPILAKARYSPVNTNDYNILFNNISSSLFIKKGTKKIDIMHIVRFIIIIPLFCILSTQLSFAQSTKADNLSIEIEQARGEKKLELMLELANMDKISPNINKLEQEAKKQENMRYLADSYVLKGNYFLSKYELDSIVYYAELANTIYEKYDIDNPNRSYLSLAYVYLNRGFYDLAISNINIYLEKHQNDPIAYQLLGHLYHLSRNYDLAKGSYQKVIEQFNQMEDVNPNISLLAYTGLATTLLYNKEFDTALETCSIMSNILNQNIDKFPLSIRSMYQFHVYNVYANTYIEMKNAEMAKLYLDKLKQIPKDGINESFYYDRINTMSLYYLLLKDYDKALNYLEESLAFCESENGDKTLLIGLTKHKIEILEQQSKFKEALLVQKELMQYKDSLNNQNLPLQVSQLSKSYELEKVRAEQQKDKAQLERNQTIIAGLIASILLLSIILYLVRRNSKKTRIKNEMLFKQYTEVDKYLSLTREYLVVEQRNKTTTGKELTLFDKIEQYILEYEAYRNPDLAREGIAEALNTNWLYVIEAIKIETGKTFLDYVNGYRLDYARLQLMSNESIPVGNIIIDSGFSSNSTFYRLFKQKFGMSPNELKRIKEKLEYDLLVKHPTEDTDDN